MKREGGGTRNEDITNFSEFEEGFSLFFLCLLLLFFFFLFVSFVLSFNLQGLEKEGLEKGGQKRNLNKREKETSTRQQVRRGKKVVES